MMLSPEQISEFKENGYLIVRNFNPIERVDEARSRFDRLFRGDFETGLQPDEWNWRLGTSDESLTRQICNGWKSDRAVARLVLDEQVGQACAELMDWPGTRINQDNVIWKPPGAREVGFHQDDTYQEWVEPPSMVTCWMALEATRREGGTIEYVRHSNHWPLQTRKFAFHAPDDYHEALKYTARHLGIEEYRIDPIEVDAGDVVFHHGKTWHGSGLNSSGKPRRTVVSHCMSSDSRYHPENVGPIYSRYKRYGSTEMDESFFPIIYRRDGHRSPGLNAFTAR
ncbi:MAG: phytanoyl-CoA dioxygenase family protein [Gammaproteobacteria bacterium]|nr:phytanoyl-CoA dioxygenase family protein [Gammaproteobacteria bacterium]MYD75532.1 phytanoyl-CoA dioxygenase family protein [Gammaproteobacteria bacterium]MYJ53216.1 phytanoyl-CoA dioxygenase family protein [Gammaproteobacteria bacterium]